MHDQSIVIDIGSGYIKAGFSGEDRPRAVLPNLIGRPKVPGIIVGADRNRAYFVATEALQRSGVLTLTPPVVRGVVEHWDDLKAVLNHTFKNVLRVEPQDYNVLLTIAPMTSPKDLEEFTYVMFDAFQVQGLALVNSAQSAIFLSGKTTGLVVDCGAGVAHCTAIVNGKPLPQAYQRMDVAGNELTDYLVTLLGERGLRFTRSDERETIRELKEKTCYVALDFAEELQRSKQGVAKAIPYQMPDGSVLTMSSERCQVPEALFKPALVGRDGLGLHEQVHQAIQRAALALQAGLYQNIVLTGGTTLLPGLAERLTKEVRTLAPENLKAQVKVTAPQGQEYGAWIGGTILASLSSFSSQWITLEEYQDAGPASVHQKAV